MSLSGRVLVLFDIDGTLVRSAGVGRRAWAAAGRAVFGGSFGLDGVSFAGRIDREIYVSLAEHNGIPRVEARTAWPRFVPAFERSLAEALEATPLEPTPGAGGLIDRLAGEAGVDLGLLTGNLEVSARMKLGSAGLPAERLPHGAYGDEADDRHGLAELALRRWRGSGGGEPGLRGGDAGPAPVVVIGDTESDMTAARHIGAGAVGVAGGRWSCDALRSLGASHAAADLADHESILGVIESRRSG